MTQETIVGGRYVLIGRLGEGGMGQVYRARHVELGKVFALKIISPNFADDTVARARFNQEAKLTSESSHPNIVSVVDYGEDARLGAYMVMELVEGEPLATQVGPMPVRRACEILAQVADALDHVHKLGIVHGDVKAENIMLASDASASRRRQIARLLDFGLARRGRDDSGLISGTPEYMAPERVRGGEASVQTDVYAIGVLGYRLLTGMLPFEGSAYALFWAHMHDTPQSLSERRGEPVDGAIEALIARAMSKDWAARHASVAAFRYELKTVMHMLGISERRRPSQPMRAVQPRDASLASVLEQSQLPQVLVTAEGDITWANSAFAKLVRCDELDGMTLADTRLASSVPDLMRCLRRVHVSGRAGECSARVDKPGAALEVVVWLAPLALDAGVHLVVRVAEVAPRASMMMAAQF